MNSLMERNIIIENKRGNNFSYTLSDNNLFLSTEYKVLQSQGSKCFVECMKMLHNGKVELLYLTSNLKSLSNIITSITPDNFLSIIVNLFTSIITTKNNGFLSCKNVDVSFDKIFVDTRTNKVKLIYIPINQHSYDDEQSFENEIRTSIVKVISNISSLSTTKTMQLSSDLQNGTLSLEKICAQLGGKFSSSPIPTREPDTTSHTSTCKLVALNSPQRFELVVSKEEYTIGKKDTNDGVVSFNKMISRVHCKITCKHSQFWISDLQSANGTYVNHVKLPSNQPHIMNNGDIVRMADSDFQVVIG